MTLEAIADDLLARLVRAFPLGYTPRIVWKNLRVTAGQARYVDGIIVLSRLVLTDELRLTDTLIHEYAHLLAVARHGRRAANHGPFWQQATRDLGAEPVVRHRYHVQRNLRRTEAVYRCKRCGTEIVKARRLPKRRRYVHLDCGGVISFHEIRSANPPEPVA